MRKYFEFAAWAVPLVFAPFTVLVMASNGSGPGDLLYPYKRGTEFIILAAASLNPTTKAFFHADLADRRYAEAETLLLAKADTTALTTFVDEVQTTQDAINGVSDEKQKAEMTQTLINKIDEYQTKLTKVEVEVANNQTTTPVPAVEQPVQQTQNTQSSQPTQQSSIQNNTAGSSAQTPQSSPPIAPTSQTSQPTQSASRPTQIQNPTTTVANATHPSQIPVPTQVVSLPPPSSIAVGVAITNTKDALDRIKEKAKKREEVKEPEIKKQETEPTKKPETKTANPTTQHNN